MSAKLPSKQELDDLLLSLFSGVEESEQAEVLAKAARPLFKVAIQSERMKSMAVGMMRLWLSSVTAAGPNLAPVLAVLMLGFHMGQAFADTSNPLPAINEQDFDKMMRNMMLDKPDKD